jgi:hypothetical protein
MRRRGIASERAEKPLPIVAGSFSFCKTHVFSLQFYLFCMAILFVLRINSNYFAYQNK